MLVIKLAVSKRVKEALKDQSPELIEKVMKAIDGVPEALPKAYFINTGGRQ